MTVFIRARTDRRLTKARTSGRTLTQAEAWEKLQTWFPSRDMTDNELRGYNQRIAAIERRRVAKGTK